MISTHSPSLYTNEPKLQDTLKLKSFDQLKPPESSSNLSSQLPPRLSSGKHLPLLTNNSTNLVIQPQNVPRLTSEPFHPLNNKTLPSKPPKL